MSTSPEGTAPPAAPVPPIAPESGHGFAPPFASPSAAAGGSLPGTDRLPGPGDGAVPGFAPYGHVPGPQLPPTGPARPANGAAIAALVLGIAALALGWLPLIGAILGALAIVFGIVAVVRRQRKGFAVTGIVLGAWGLLTSVIISVVLVVVSVNGEGVRDAFWAGFQEGLTGETAQTPSGEPSEPSGATPSADPSADPSDARAEFAELDDAGLAAIVDDPAAAYGEKYVVYGEVQYVDDANGPCVALVIIDGAQQTSWEGYETTAWLYPVEDDGTCGDLAEFEEFSHVRLWATAYGSATTEWDDGTAEDVLVFEMADFEMLPALP